MYTIFMPNLSREGGGERERMKNKNSVLWMSVTLCSPVERGRLGDEHGTRYKTKLQTRKCGLRRCTSYDRTCIYTIFGVGRSRRIRTGYEYIDVVVILCILYEFCDEEMTDSLSRFQPVKVCPRSSFPSFYTVIIHNGRRCIQYA